MTELTETVQAKPNNNLPVNNLRDSGKFHLDQLESEAIYIMREVVAEFRNPVMLYSVGKDSSVLLRIAQKAFYPSPIPFPLLHIDTGYKFQEMIDFRDKTAKDLGLDLIVHRNENAISMKMHPGKYGVAKCCGALKTEALLSAISKYGFDAAIGGARRDEEKSRAKERIFSFRDEFGQWNPKKQRPELWQIYNTSINENESVRVFPLSNWSELDIWNYIRQSNIPIVPLYFAKPRHMIQQGKHLIPLQSSIPTNGDELPPKVMCRFRTLGCAPCTGAMRSSATTLDEIIEELALAQRSERESRLIDHGTNSMEDKKKEGYF